MREIDQFVHITKDIDSLKSILENGLYTSYSKEIFDSRNILLPMISFSNILFRDIGETETVDYGNYGISISRNFGINDLKLNPVIYYSESLIENSMLENFYISLHSRFINYINETSKKYNTDFKISQTVEITPKPNEEMLKLLDLINSKSDEKLLNQIVLVFDKIGENSLAQILLSKHYKVKTKAGIEKIAYNEREWRRSFLDLSFYFETNKEGVLDLDYEKWSNMPKPHYNSEEYTLKIPIKQIDNIFVSTKSEILEIQDFIKYKFPDYKRLPNIDILKNLKEK